MGTVDTSFSGVKGNGCEDVMIFKTPRVKDDLPDITCIGEDMFHSDGVGLIRKELLEDILKEVPFGTRYKKESSAIQIRYGGAKG